MNRPSKYRSRATTIDGQFFHSLAEAARYSELRVLEQAGLIEHLQRQVRFKLQVNGYLIGHYTVDHTYVEDGVLTAEEKKGSKKAMSRDAILRMRLFRALYPEYRYLVHDTRHGCVRFEDWA